MIMNFCVQIIGNNTKTQTTDERKMLSGEKRKNKNNLISIFAGFLF